MTVIAAFAIGGIPTVFGDLLLTGPVATSGQVIAVPALGEVQDFFGNSGWGVSGLTQKVNLLAENCAIAWAGSWIGARVAIAGLKSLAATEPLTLARIEAHLRSEKELERNEASFVGIVHEGDGLRMFHFNAEEHMLDYLGQVFMSGSGSGAIREFDALSTNSDIRSTGAPTETAAAVSKCLMLGGMLLQSELHGADAAATLRNLFGAGYEIAFFSGGRLQKVPEITYLVWDADLADHEVRRSHPLLVVKQQYVGDYLLVRSARITSSPQDPTPRVIEEQRHAISPMYETTNRPNADELMGVSLESRLICHCIATRRGATMAGIYTAVQYFGPESEMLIRIRDEPGHIVLSFRQDLLEKITGAVERFR